MGFYGVQRYQGFSGYLQGTGDAGMAQNRTLGTRRGEKWRLS